MKRLFVIGLFVSVAIAQVTWARSARRADLAIRGVPQRLYVFDPSTRKPGLPTVLVLSGDGGWHGFIAEVAEYLAQHGYFTVGLDAKEYLESLSKPKALEPTQITEDVAFVARFAKDEGQSNSVVLVGWSEGAGLAVLGGLDPTLRKDLRGVIAVSLPELNELAWRWTDSIIYVTKKVPNEPTFDSKDYVGRLSPLPLMLIQSTQDDFVPVATAREIFARAQEPKQIVFIDARNHRFEGQRDAFWQTLDRAFDWFGTLAAKPPR